MKRVFICIFCQVFVNLHACTLLLHVKVNHEGMFFNFFVIRLVDFIYFLNILEKYFLIKKMWKRTLLMKVMKISHFIWTVSLHPPTQLIFTFNSVCPTSTTPHPYFIFATFLSHYMLNTWNVKLINFFISFLNI